MTVRGFSIRIAVFASGLVLALLLCEAALRFFFPQPLYAFERDMFRPAPAVGYTLTPGTEKTHAQPEYAYTVRANSFGFRGREPDGEAAKRVLVLGDSFGWGQGVQEGAQLTEVSRDRFREEGRDIDIFNTSLPGYAGVNQVGVLQRLGPVYRPDLVVLLFYWNDIGQTESLHVENGFLVLRAGHPWSAPAREWLNNHSHLYCLVKRSYYMLKGPPGEVRAGGRYRQEAMAAAAGVISEMKRLCDGLGAGFVVALLPYAGVHDGGTAFKESKAGFISLLSADGIAYEDWAMELPAAGRDRLAYRFDAHWTAEGHRHFSAVLNRTILRSLGES